MSQHQNPLIEKKVRGFKDFEEWMDRWRKAETFTELEGLIHGIFDSTQNYDEKVRAILFLLKIADGHNSYENFENPNISHLDRIHHDEEVRKRQKIAKKALNILCQNFFKNISKDSDEKSWISLTSNPMVFKSVVWFFRKEKYSKRLENARDIQELNGSSFINETIDKFLDNFLRWAFNFLYYLGWDLENNNELYGPEIKERVKKTIETIKGEQGNLVEIIHCSKKTDVLFSHEGGAPFSYKLLTEPAMERLRGLVGNLNDGIRRGDKTAFALIRIKELEKEEGE